MRKQKKRGDKATLPGAAIAGVQHTKQVENRYFRGRSNGATATDYFLTLRCASF
jgi:hypothetical protein